MYRYRYINFITLNAHIIGTFDHDMRKLILYIAFPGKPRHGLEVLKMSTYIKREKEKLQRVLLI